MVRLRCSLALFVLALGCSAPDATVQPGEHLVSIAVPQESELPLTVELQDGAIICTRDLDGPSIPYITFERRGDATAYGIYGLFGPKNGLPVALPLTGDPIAYDDLDHEGALLLQLERAGLASTDARTALERHAPTWFAEGLRVLFLIDPELAPAFVDGRQDTDHRPLVVRVELPDATDPRGPEPK